MIKESLFSSTDLPEPIDRFIHDLIEGQETVRVETKTEKDSLQAVIKLDIESQNLPPIELRKFFGNPGEWSEFIENFKTRVHEKAVFTDSKCFKGDAKKSICSIGNNRLFYATSLKILKREFGNPLVVTNIKMSALLDRPQISGNDKISLRSFHHHLKYTNTWLSKMGYTSCIQSSEYLTKAVMILPNYLRNSF